MSKPLIVLACLLTGCASTMPPQTENIPARLMVPPAKLQQAQSSEPRDVLMTVAQNYESCNLWRLQLIEWQDIHRMFGE